MRKSHVLVTIVLAVGLLIAAPLGAQVIKETVPGITNFARVESTVACAGAITAQSVPEIKKYGFKSIINLRLAEEPGANVEAEAAAAKSAGLSYVHVPFNGQMPDPAAVDKFLTAITSPGVEPAFIHCAGGNRAALMWFIKRVEVDGWDINRATEEATALGLTSAPLKQFALTHIQAHKK